MLPKPGRSKQKTMGRSCNMDPRKTWNAAASIRTGRVVPRGHPPFSTVRTCSRALLRNGAIERRPFCLSESARGSAGRKERPTPAAIDGGPAKSAGSACPAGARAFRFARGGGGISRQGLAASA